MAWQPDYIDVDQLGHFLRIDDIVDDVELAVAITAASRSIDHYTNRQFGLTDDVEERLYTARPDHRTGYWVVEIDDVMVTGSPVVTVDGNAVTTFVREPANARQQGRPWTRLAFGSDAQYQPTGTTNEVAVSTQWGWTSVPVPVQQATLLQSSRLFTRRNAPFGIAGSPADGSEMRLLAKLDPDVCTTVWSYKRLRSAF